MNDETDALLYDRMVAYGLLARLFACEVDANTLAAIAELGTSADADAGADAGTCGVEGQNPNPEGRAEGTDLRGFDRMADWLAHRGVDPQVETELAVDYARLFIVRDKDCADAAYPFESVYASPERLMVSCALEDVKRRYREAALKLDEGLTLSEDHIAIELAYMRRESEHALEAFRSRDDEALHQSLERQGEFLDKHLLLWVDPFAKAVQRHARTDFYQGLAEFLLDYLHEDAAALASWEDPGEDGTMAP